MGTLVLETRTCDVKVCCQNDVSAVNKGLTEGFYREGFSWLEHRLIPKTSINT